MNISWAPTTSDQWQHNLDHLQTPFPMFACYHIHKPFTLGHCHHQLLYMFCGPFHTIIKCLHCSFMHTLSNPLTTLLLLDAFVIVQLHLSESIVVSASTKCNPSVCIAQFGSLAKIASTCNFLQPKYLQKLQARLLFALFSKLLNIYVCPHVMCLHGDVSFFLHCYLC